MLYKGLVKMIQNNPSINHVKGKPEEGTSKQQNEPINTLFLNVGVYHCLRMYLLIGQLYDLSKRIFHSYVVDVLCSQGRN
jgi:hypothetical protein